MPEGRSRRAGAVILGVAAVALMAVVTLACFLLRSGPRTCDAFAVILGAANEVVATAQRPMSPVELAEAVRAEVRTRRRGQWPVDGWGRPIVMDVSIEDGTYRVVLTSAGGDGRAGTPDDTTETLHFVPLVKLPAGDVAPDG